MTRDVNDQKFEHVSSVHVHTHTPYVVKNSCLKLHGFNSAPVPRRVVGRIVFSISCIFRGRGEFQQRAPCHNRLGRTAGDLSWIVVCTLDRLVLGVPYTLHTVHYSIHVHHGLHHGPYPEDLWVI